MPNILSREQFLEGSWAQSACGAYLHHVSTLQQAAPSHLKCCQSDTKPFPDPHGFSQSLRLCSHLLSGDVCLSIVPLLREDDVEDSVGAAAGLIHIRGSHCAVGRGGQGGMTLCRRHGSGWQWGRGSFQDRVHDGKANLEDRRGLWEEMCKSPGCCCLQGILR